MTGLATDAAEVAGASAVRRLGQGSVGFVRLVLRNKVGFLGFLVFAIIVLLSFIGPFFTPENPPNTTRIYQPPSGAAASRLAKPCQNSSYDSVNPSPVTGW